jgi:hypothetical protein
MYTIQARGVILVVQIEVLEIDDQILDKIELLKGA